jgi:hypothetical protein
MGDTPRVKTFGENNSKKLKEMLRLRENKDIYLVL